MEITERVIDIAMDASDQAWSREEGRFTSWRQMDPSWRRTARDAMKAALVAALEASADQDLKAEGQGSSLDADGSDHESNVFYAFGGCRVAGRVF